MSRPLSLRSVGAMRAGSTWASGGPYSKSLTICSENASTCSILSLSYAPSPKDCPALKPKTISVCADTRLFLKLAVPAITLCSSSIYLAFAINCQDDLADP